MGADLYVKGIDAPITGFEVSKRAAESGYFRDPYNPGGLFANIGLSWWILQNEYIDARKMTKKCDLKPKYVDEFAATVEKAFAKSSWAKINQAYIDWMEIFRIFIAKAKSVGKGIHFSC